MKFLNQRNNGLTRHFSSSASLFRNRPTSNSEECVPHESLNQGINAVNSNIEYQLSTAKPLQDGISKASSMSNKNNADYILEDSKLLRDGELINSKSNDNKLNNNNNDNSDSLSACSDEDLILDYNNYLDLYTESTCNNINTIRSEIEILHSDIDRLFGYLHDLDELDNVM